MRINKFEDLKVWRDSLKIVKIIYDLTALPKFSKDFTLRDQIRRAAISISSNIVEGFEKNNNNEFIRFLKIAKGSVGEARSQIHIASAVAYISDEDFKKVNQELEELANQIGSFISYLEKSRKQGKFIRK